MKKIQTSLNAMEEKVYKCICIEKVSVKDSRDTDVILYKNVRYYVRKGYGNNVVVEGRFGGFYENGEEYSIMETRFINKDICKKYLRYV